MKELLLLQFQTTYVPETEEALETIVSSVLSRQITELKPYLQSINFSSM